MRRVNCSIYDVGTALRFLYNFHREHSLLKSIIKKLSPKINVKNIKKFSRFVDFSQNRQGRLVHVRTVVAATCIKMIESGCTA